MAIRDKIKAKFSKNKTTSGSNSPPRDSSIPGHYTGRTDVEYYKPHEIPKSKYRGRVDKVHQDKLEAFSLEDAFQTVRRASAAMSGTFSPGGTKAFSRRTSYVSNVGARTPARSRRSSLSSDANASFSVPSSGTASTHLNSIPVATADDGGQEDSGTENADLSKIPTTQTFNAATGSDLPKIQLERQATLTDSDATSHHVEVQNSSSETMPFTTEELTHAITRAAVTPPLNARRTSVAVL